MTVEADVKDGKQAGSNAGQAMAAIVDICSLWMSRVGFAGVIFSLSMLINGFIIDCSL